MCLVKCISPFEVTDNEPNDCLAPFTTLHTSRFTNDE